MNLQQSNLEYLLETYYRNTGAPAALAYLSQLVRRHKDRQLSFLLLSHREARINSARINRLKAAANDLIAFSSII